MSISVSAHPKIVAITQIVAHPSLDEVRHGIVDFLQQEQDGGRLPIETDIIFENAQGNITIAAQIATHFVSKKPDVIVPITTPSAQAVMRAARNTTIPIVFASITDPVGVHLVPNLQHPGRHVTGTRNATPIHAQLVLIKQLLPKAKNIGILINDAEENAVALLRQVEANQEGLHVIVAPARHSAELHSAMLSLVGKVDVLLLLQDNTVASGLPVVIKIAGENHIPVVAGYSEAVKKGALLSLAVDEYVIGIETGKLVARILQGEKAGNISVQEPMQYTLTINLKTSAALGIVIQNSLKEQAHHMIGDE